MNGMEKLREYADATKWGGECRILHAHHGDFAGDCSERECNECRAAYLRTIADGADAELRDMGARLMPDGMEWPRFEGDEPVGIGDMAVLADGNPHEVESIEFFADKSCKLKGKGTPWMQTVFKGQRAKRPPVLAADGEPLEVGQTVWEVDGTGHPFKVVSIRPSTCRAMEPTVVTCDVGDGTSEHILPSQLTHQRPVLDADGVEVHKGDEVWSTTGEFDGKRTVSSVHIDPDEPPYATFEERQKPYSCLCCYLIHRAPVLAADGKPLEAGQTVYGTRDLEPVEIVSLRSKEYDGVHTVKCKDRTGFVFYAPDDLTHQRPVLDADGVPIKVGDTVWDIETGCRRTVRAVNDNETVEFDGYENRGWFGKFLTHRAPVLAADGKPLEVGDRVWWTWGGQEYVVEQVRSNEEVYVTLANGEFSGQSANPRDLTHVRHDSWEKWREDSELRPIDYCVMIGYPPSEEESTELIKNRDLVRRARKLAERGER